MFAHAQHCRRCGEKTEAHAARTIESAGEKIPLCAGCYAAFKDWFFSGIPDSTPAAEFAGEPA